MIALSRIHAEQSAVGFAALKLDEVSLNPQPLPPRDPGYADGLVLASRGALVSLNPQPLPPKAIGSAIADLFGKAGITFGGKTPGSPVMMPEEDEMPPSPPPKSEAKSRLAEVGIIIVGGKNAEVAMAEEDEMPTPPAPKAEAFALRSLAAQSLGAILDQSIQQMAKARV